MQALKKFRLGPWIDGLLALFYPETCMNCQEALNQYERYLCRPCISRLPLTGFENQPDNPVVQTFWGRTQVHFAASIYHYRKGETLQGLIGRLKYQGDPLTGVFLGQLAGKTLRKAKGFPRPDYLIPVPLHPRRQRKRGYNQCEMIARGLSEILSIPIETSLLKRAVFNPSQTRKGRYERWENVEGIFQTTYPIDQFHHKHLLLVDDILTTGATLEACCAALSQIPGATISVVTVGYASRY
jgi:ComF family protein